VARKLAAMIRDDAIPNGARLEATAWEVAS